MSWGSEKDAKLRRERNVGFSDVVEAMQSGKLLADTPHTNPARFPVQRMLIVEIGVETYVVPYVEDDRSIFLKTIYPSRMARRTYGRRKT